MTKNKLANFLTEAVLNELHRSPLVSPAFEKIVVLHEEAIRARLNKAIIKCLEDHDVDVEAPGPDWRGSWD